MAEIICPMCGRPNPEGLDVCQFCEAQLRSVTDQLSRSQPPIKAGEDPKQVDTGELEPVLPQWLRDIRQKAREATEESEEPVESEAQEEELTEPQEEKEGKEKKPLDLLAGLASQSDEFEEIPDWLASIREEEPTESNLPDMMEDLQEDAEIPQTGELGGIDSLAWDSGQDETEAIFPDQEMPADFGDKVTQTGDSEIPGWLKNIGAEGSSQNDELIPATAPSEGPAEPVFEEPATPAIEGDISDWLAELSGEQTTETESIPAVEEPSQTTGEDTSVPDWLASIGSDDAVQAEPGFSTGESAPPHEDGERPDWLFPPDEEDAARVETTPGLGEASQPSEQEREIPDWLSSLRDEEPAEDETPLGPGEPIQPAQEEETPDWLSSLGEDETTEANTTPEPGEPIQLAQEEETPDWLSSLREGEPAEAETPLEPGEPIQPEQEEETPDWLEALDSESQKEKEPEEPVASSFDEDALQFASEEDQPAGDITDKGTQISDGDLDAIFSMDMPDWLEDVGGKEQSIDAEAEDETATIEDLSPASLPDWVQAMRPVESVISEVPDSDELQDIEEMGPFAGLAGVLPPMPDYSPSSKPKSYAIKLVANEEQQENAALLERLLASETHPNPVKSQTEIRSQRILRWLITILMVIVVGGVMFSGTQIIPMPVGMPREAWAAVQIVEGIPENAPVLLIFDYEAARAGEMEVAAGGLIDHMLLLKHPRLALLASKPTGTGLAGRFMSIIQSGHNYQDGQQMLNLGYLPGGAAGVLGFSKNPKVTMPVAANGSPAWESTALQGVNNISDFATIILLSDDAENARIWIEQLEADNSLDTTSFIVVSSGQSGPMILPYLQSGQVDGIVIGLDNNASIEQYNAGRPGLARGYWDAYGFGLLTAVAIIILGSFWNLISAFQARRTNNNGEG